MTVDAPTTLEPAFSVLDAEPVLHQAAPVLRFHLHVTDPLGRDVQAIALSTQIGLDPARRSYDDDTRARLVDLFGAPDRWPSTTQAISWGRVDTLVKAFVGATSFTVDLPCTYDLEVAATKYLYSLPDGEAPLSLLFNGMVLYREHDRLQVAQVPWSCTARWRLPVATWKRLMAAYYPGGGWVRLHTETLDALAQRKAERGDHSFDDTIRGLLS